MYQMENNGSKENQENRVDVGMCHVEHDVFDNVLTLCKMVLIFPFFLRFTCNLFYRMRENTRELYHPQ